MFEGVAVALGEWHPVVVLMSAADGVTGILL